MSYIRLPAIQIESPCSMDWKDLSGSEESRFCASCQKNVLNFETMSEAQIRNSLARGSDICARIVRDNQGSIVTADSHRKPKRRLKLASKLATLAASVLTVSIAGCVRENAELDHSPLPAPEPPPPASTAMGGICFGPVEATESTPTAQDPEPQVELLGRIALPQEKPQDPNH